MTIDCIIVEDEPLALTRIKGYVEKVPYLNLKGTYSNGLDALVALKKEPISLIFLDIEMEDLTGMQLLKALPVVPEVIITTAYEKYALSGYKFSVTDYLLKPFGFDRFLRAVEKSYENIKVKPPKSNQFLFVKTEYRMEKVNFEDILYIEGMGDYRNVQTTKKKILTLQTFIELEKLLPTNEFCRVHKSYLVSINKIDFIERSRIKIGEQRIPISETYKARFYDLVGYSK